VPSRCQVYTRDYRHHHGAGTAVSDRLVAGKVLVARAQTGRLSDSEKAGSARYAIVTSSFQSG
jgi:hypothetical protein